VRGLALAFVLLASSAQAEITSDDLLFAAECIGAAETGLEGAAHIKPDPQRAANIAFAFSELLKLPISPPAEAMEDARKQGRQQEETPPDDFSSVEAIMAEVGVAADCVAVIDQLGFLPVIYPQCFPEGCPPAP
jgi:hypothetical protein